MLVRAKTKRRLIFLVAGLLVLSTLAGVAVLARMAQLAKRDREYRANGIAALQAKEYVTALDQLGRYLRKNLDDTEAMFLYAKARLNVEDRDDKHILDGISFLRQVIDRQPGNVEAVRLLVNVYSDIGYNQEVITLANAHLTKNPDDLEVLRAKAIAEGRLGQYDQAMQDANRCVQLAPKDLDSHILTLFLMHRLGTPAEKVLARAEELRKANADDARFQLLQGIAYRIVDDSVNSLAWLREAAARAPADTAFVRLLVRQFDAAGQFDESLNALERAADAGGDDKLRRLYFQRLWQSGRYAQVVDRSATISPTDNAADSEILALRCMSLLQTGASDQATPIIEALAKRKGDRTAAGWAQMLTILASPEKATGTQMIEACRKALNRDPTNAQVQFLLGEAQQSQDEIALALSSWRQAAELAPSWALPHLRIAQALLASGQIAQSQRSAMEGMTRAPSNVEAAVTLLRCMNAGLNPQDKDQVERLLALTTQILQVMPGEAQALITRVQLLAPRDSKAAVETVRSVLANPKTVKGPTLLRLAQLSKQGKLGVEAECFDVYEKQFGVTPDLAFTKATNGIATEGVAQALPTFDALMAKVSTAIGDVNWGLQRARLLDVTASPDAAKAWKELVEKNGSEARVIRAASESRSVQSDRALTDQVIEKLKAVSGENGAAWRLARARWMLGEPNASNRNFARAAVLLNDVIRVSPSLVEPRVLLARCMEGLNNIEAAIEQYTIVSEIDPDLKMANMELARLLQVRGEYERAREKLKPVLGSRSLTSTERQQVASLLTRQGEIGPAISLLEKTGDATGADRLLLAELYLRQGQTQRAEAIVRDTVEKNPDTASIRFLATILASSGNVAAAQSVLTKLDALKLAPGTKEMALGDFELRFGTVAQAMDRYRAASGVAPQNVTAWERQIACAMYLGKIDDALKIAKLASDALPENTSFKFLLSNTPLIQEVKDIEDCHPFMYALVDDPANRAAALEVMKILSANKQRGVLDPGLLSQLRPLAERNPRFLHVQNLITRIAAGLGRTDEAITLASRTMQAFPAAVEPAQRAAELLGASGRWSEALSVAQVWRQRTPGNPRTADLFIAAALRQTGNTAESLKRSGSYLAGAMSDPDKFASVISLHASTLMSTGQSAEVIKFLEPHLSKSQAVRSIWVDLAAATPDPATWLDRVAPYIPENAVDERAALALSFEQASQRTRKPALAQRARKIVSELLGRSDATAFVFEVGAGLILADGDWTTAEKLYRRVLTIKADSPTVLNNLSVIIAHNGGSLQEAVSMARAAVAARPGLATFHDSLATALLKSKDIDGAIASLREAVRIEPANLTWRVTLIGVLTDAERIDDLIAALRDIDPMLTSGTVTAEQKARLDAARALIGKRAAAVGH